MSKEKDQLFFRNFAISIGVLCIMLIAFLVIARIYGMDRAAQIKQQEETVMQRTAPVGQVATSETVSEDSGEMADEEMAGSEMAGEEMAAATPAGDGDPAVAGAAAEQALDGAAIYNQLCIACHSVEGIGAPILGNTEDWAPRIAQGQEMLYERAINGYIGPEGYMMPARGGGQLSDDEVKAAVDYMVMNSQ